MRKNSDKILEKEEINLEQELNSILKEDFLDKQSRHLKSWRKRWFVLTPNLLLTYKEKQLYDKPTEIIPLKALTGVKTCEEKGQKQFSFIIRTLKQGYLVAASSAKEKDQWMGQIAKTMVQNSRMTKQEYMD